MTLLNDDSVFILNDDVIKEDFEEESLLFLCRQRRLFELNRTSGLIIDYIIDGGRLTDIIEKYSKVNTIDMDQAKYDVEKFILKTLESGIIKEISKNKQNRNIANEKRYMVCPDVWTRKETDRAILLKSDANEFKIINLTGEIIWEYIKTIPKTQNEIIENLKTVCSDIPLEEIKEDIERFLLDLQEQGFIEEIADEN